MPKDEQEAQRIRKCLQARNIHIPDNPYTPAYESRVGAGKSIAKSDFSRHPEFIYRDEKILESRGSIMIMSEQTDLGNGFRDRYRTHHIDGSFGIENQLVNLIATEVKIPDGYYATWIRYNCVVSIPQIADYFQYAILVNDTFHSEFAYVGTGMQRHLIDMPLYADEKSKIQIGVGLVDDADDVVVQEVSAVARLIVYAQAKRRE